MSYVKQVLVWRADLRNAQGNKVRSGKMAAQLAHASMAALLGLMQEHKTIANGTLVVNRTLTTAPDSALDQWLSGKFTKICVTVDSEQELLDLYQQAQKAGIICSLITDSGLTEFDGVPTITALAIGPDFSDNIDIITCDLNLL